MTAAGHTSTPMSAELLTVVLPLMPHGRAAQELYRRVCQYQQLEERLELLDARFIVRGALCMCVWLGLLGE